MESATETQQVYDYTRREFVHRSKVKSLSSSFPRGEAFEQSTCLGKPQMMQVSWPPLILVITEIFTEGGLKGAGRLTLELISDYGPREIYVETQNPAYYF